MEQEHINELKTQLAVISAQLDGVNDHLVRLNGNTRRNVDDISELKISEASIISTMKSTKWIAGVALTIISSIALYAYNSDRKELSLQTTAVAAKAEQVARDTEKVKSDLTIYQNSQQDNWNMVITRLESTIPAEKLQMIKAKEKLNDKK